MGRIADALKKAEQERAAAGGVAVAEPPGNSADGSDTTTAPASRPQDETIRTAPRAPTAETLDIAEVEDGLRRASPLLVALHGSDSILIEQYRSLRTRLSSQNPRLRSRVLTVTSSQTGEGKSVTVGNLGIVMAEVRHHQILLLDADFRRGTLAKLFGLENEPGLVDVLQGETHIDEVIRRTIVPNLFVVPAGSVDDSNPAELLSSKRAAAIFDDLRDRYTYVLVDTPPSSDVADAGIVGQLADAAFLVIHMGKTPQPVVRKVVQTLQASHINLLGCVLTSADDASVPYTEYEYYASTSG